MKDEDEIESLLDDYAKVKPTLDREGWRNAFTECESYGGFNEMVSVIRAEIEKRTVAMELMGALGGDPREIIRILDSSK